ncbi:prokaryotic type I DNA topoisomerase [Trametes coccinea BRFM310]|uniref:DNA topoisomerase n=1 Tax=Trametes coccinea (strain BRFM310) TaxID=1353009 RepID=A0A1Y2J0N0_TRAC3|nr:prokaryotic type I DNA topoisomerase [Trametes coccinea BRFM310]
MRVLCVAEKPSIAKSITQILSGGQYTTRNSRNKYIKNYDFNYPQTNSFFTVTSVTGHVMEYDFNIMYSKWTSCDPFALFEAPVECKVKNDAKTIAENLKTEARRAQTLMIWTDCDREGENIGAEIMKICRSANANITVKRARFSAIIAQQIHNAAQHPIELDMAQSHAVETRILLDLRIGAAFTRLQTLNLQNRYEALKKELVSYGPCQFPTLGFVVARYNKVKNFKPEQFWYIHLSLSRPSTSDSDPEEIVFTWRRGHLFDHPAAVALYSEVLKHDLARVTKVTIKDTKKWKPLPLTTVDLQKAGSRLLKISPKRVLDIAESLYQRGFLSYPRTETDIFDPQFDFMTLIGKQTADPAWGGFASGLQNGGFNPPRRGKKDDHAHPPIHPTAHAGNLAGDEKRVYEYITRRFLACCSKDALGWQTTVDVQYGDEEFYATGLIIRERNYLDVFPYDKWADKELPNFQEGETFVPAECRLDEGHTSKPNLLTEADLVNLMDEHGIGTDATIAQHIQTIIDRGYVIERMQGATKYLIPSTLGIGLVEGYDAIGFDQSLSKPELRRETERRMVDICQGAKSKNEVLMESIERYKEMFVKTRMEFQKLVEAVGNRINGQGPVPEIDLGEAHEDDDEGGGGGGRGGGGGAGGGGGGGGRGGSGGTRARRGSTSTRGTASTRGKRGRGRGGSSGSVQPPPPPPPPRPPAPAPAPAPAALAQEDEDAMYWSDNDASAAPVPPPRPPPVTVSRGPFPSGSDSTHPQCECGVPAAERTVVKESANKGKKFWTCGQDRTCQFFQWADASSTASSSAASSSTLATRSTPTTYSATSTVVPSKRPFSTVGTQRRCDCDLTAVLKESTSASSKGRKYWSCPNGSRIARCKYFEWAADDEDGPVAQPKRSYSSGPASGPQGSAGGGGGGGSGSCFRCGQEGHWASACPNEPQRSTSFAGGGPAGGGGGGASGACFKCGEEGHYSNACPNGRRDQGNGSDNSCFKCGKPGHFSNACPGGASASTSSRRGSSTRGKRGRGRGAKGSGSTRGRKKSSFAAADESF